MEKNYKDTLNLPKTSFPMKANLPVREVEIQSFWEKTGIYKKIRLKRKGAPKYLLHDGPPYANESIHIGTALNKILKDFVVKTRTMAGLDAPYVPGWDCHGLPIELAAMKKMGGRASALHPSKLRQKCRRHAEKYVNIQRREFKRLGVFGEWENPYLTMSPEYEAAELEIFRKLWKDGYVYRGLRPIHWCPSCRTALADAEIEYGDKTSPSIFVKFRLLENMDEAKNLTVSLLVWTTTPWTLAANAAVAVKPGLEYVFFEHDGEVYAAAAPLFEGLKQKLGFPGKVIFSKQGAELKGLKAKHPFIDRESPVVGADFVSGEEGTGFVHSAPGHGREDFEMGARMGLPVICPVDEAGKFTDEAGSLAGLNVFEADSRIIKKLEEEGTLVHSEDILHSYPNCWRCKKPLITRATEQWFISLSKNGLREKVAREIENVEWLPAWGKTRISGMASSRPDWCISRQRLWGVPIPVFYCVKCGEVIASDAAMKRIRELVSEHSSDVWFDKDIEELAGGRVLCGNCGSSEIKKETDIFDVWFDSGVSFHAVCTIRNGLGFPADLYLEGTDQHRGWFQTSLIASTASRGEAPYRTVLTHGFMVDGEGRKMSKSIGNLISAGEMFKNYGADVLRLWVSAEDYRNDIRFSEEILAGISESYRRFRNTARYILGNISDFDPARDSVPFEEMPGVERWVLHRLHSLLKTAVSAYEAFEFHKVYHSVHDFCAVTLSAFYFDVIKDRLYTSPPGDRKRRASQTVLLEILDNLLRLMAPLIPHTCEEAWQHFETKGEREESIHLESMPEPLTGRLDESLAAEWDVIMEARKAVNKKIENARNSGLIGNSLQASVVLGVPKGEAARVLETYKDELPEIFIVSEVRLADGGGSEITAEVERTLMEKCPRCWKYTTSGKEREKDNTVCSQCAEALQEARKK